MSALLTKWTPFDVACRLRSLQQSSLAIGNTQQNKTNLYNLAVAQANGAAVWAKWRGGNNVAQNHSNLLVQVKLVPGYTAPPGTYGNPQSGGSGGSSDPAMTAGTFTGSLSVNGQAYGSGTFSGYAGSAANHQFGSLAGSPTVNGNAIEVIVEDGGGALWVILAGTLAKNAFTSVSYTDTNGPQTFLTANANEWGSLAGYSYWVWDVAVGAFTNGDVYSVTFS